MKIDPVIRSVDMTLKQLVELAQNRTTFTDNISCVFVNFDTGTPPNTTITIDHNLGRVPIGWIANPDNNANVYDDNRASWTTTQMTVKCSNANVQVYMVVF